MNNVIEGEDVSVDFTGEGELSGESEISQEPDD